MTTMIFFSATMHQKPHSSFFFLSRKCCWSCFNSHAHTHITAEANPWCTNEQHTHTHTIFYTNTYMHTHTHTQPVRRIKALQPQATQGERDCIRWTLYLICCHSVWKKNHHRLFWFKPTLIINIHITIILGDICWKLHFRHRKTCTLKVTWVALG